jgi:hypothetical protein
MRRQAAVQHVAQRQHINSEHVRLAELQYTVDILHQQERQEPLSDQRQQHLNANRPPPPPYYHIPPLPPQNYNIPHHQPPSPPHNQYTPPPLQFDTTDPKSQLDNHLQLAPWPQITEPLLHPSITKVLTLVNFSCLTKPP